MRAKTVSEQESYIRDAAIARGIDPDKAVKVAKSEGLGSKSWQSNMHKNGRREKSYGPFQLNTEKGRLGAQFMKATGLDPRDPSTVEAQIDFALDHAAKHGWGSWYGAARVGVAKREGLANAQPIGVQAAPAAFQTAKTVPTSAPQGLLASMFADPLGLQAQASEMPGGMAPLAPPKQQAQIDYFGSVPTSTWGPQREEAVAAQTMRRAPSSFPSRLGVVAPNTMRPGVDIAETPQDMERLTVQQAQQMRPSVDVAETPADIERMTVQQAQQMRPAVDVAETPADIARMTVEQAAATAPAPSANRLGAVPADRFAPGLQAPQGPFSPENYASVLSPQEQAAPAPAPALSAPKNVRDYNVAPANMASTSPEALAPSPEYTGLTPNMAQGMPRADYAAKFGALDPTMAPNSPEISALAYGPDDQTISDPNSFPAAPGSVGPEGQTISGDFPPAPEDSMFGPISKAALTGLLTGGPIGGLLGAASGMFSGGLGSLGGGPAGRPSEAESYNAGSGLGGMQQGINGPRGATGYSRSNPGTFSRSRGFGLGSDLTNQYGYTTTYGPSGDIRANSGTMDAWGRVLGGLFDRPDKSKKGQSGRGLGGLSQATHDAIGKGLGGLY